MNKLSKRVVKKVLILSIPILFVFILFIFAVNSSRLIPYNMDEFIHYQHIGCTQYERNNIYNDGSLQKEYCQKYDLRLPFTGQYLSMRNYIYIGSAAQYIFYPFWFLIGQPAASRVQGAFFFIVVLILLKIISNRKFVDVLLASAIFPVFFFTFLVDTGPVGLTLIILLSSIILLRKIFAVEVFKLRSTATALSVAVGLLCFINFWIKPNSLWLIPALIIYVLWNILLKEKALKDKIVKYATSLIFIVISFLVPALTLLFMETRQGFHYIHDFRGVGGVVSSLMEFNKIFQTMFSFFTDGNKIVQKVLVIPKSFYDSIPIFISYTLIIWFYITKKRKFKQSVWWLLMGAITFLVMIMQKETFYNHHFVLVLPFFILFFIEIISALSYRNKVVLLLIIAFYFSTILFRIPFAKINFHSGKGKDVILSKVIEENIDQRAINVHVDWGTYQIKNLFGDKSQVNLFIEKDKFDDPNNIQKIINVATKEHKEILIYELASSRVEEYPKVIEQLGGPESVLKSGEWSALYYKVTK